jgi:hypothetical protein
MPLPERNLPPIAAVDGAPEQQRRADRPPGEQAPLVVGNHPLRHDQHQLAVATVVPVKHLAAHHITSPPPDQDHRH